MSNVTIKRVKSDSSKHFNLFYVFAITMASIAVLFLANFYIMAWTEPTQAPPGGTPSGALSLWTKGAGDDIYKLAGNVGIGTSNPGSKLHVSGNGGTAYIAQMENSGVHGLYIKTTGITPSHDQLTIDDNSGTVFGVYAGGETYIKGSVGIGATNEGGELAISPGLKLDVEGKVGATEYCDQNGSVCRSISDMALPSGLIAMFTTNCPEGWTRFSNLDGRVARGSSSYGATGGSGTHHHGEGKHFTIHDYTRNDGSATVSNWPPYLEVIWCQKN